MTREKKILLFSFVFLVSLALAVFIFLEKASEAKAHGEDFVSPTLILRIALTVGLVDPNSAEDGRLPLIASLDTVASHHPYEFAEILLNHGANVNQSDNRGWTPLMQATAFGFPDGVDLLIRHRAYINQENDEGKTAIFYFYNNLHQIPVLYGSRQDYYKTLHLLLAAGADACHKDKSGNTPADLLTSDATAKEMLILACRSQQRSH